MRDKMRVYSWIGGDRPDDVVTEAKKRVDAGMTAVKMNGTEEMAWIDSFTRIEEVISRVQALRDAFGHSWTSPLTSTAGSTCPWQGCS